MCRLLPLLLPAKPNCACGFDAWLPPTTTAPTGFPAINPGTMAAGLPGVGSPVKKYPARENPARAVFTTFDEKTCVSSRLKTCSRRLTRSVENASNGVAVTLPLSSMV